STKEKVKCEKKQSTFITTFITDESLHLFIEDYPTQNIIDMLRLWVICELMPCHPAKLVCTSMRRSNCAVTAEVILHFPKP
ncbi:hypothetical protein L9F63_007564, partial [Diploptera punctata]